MGTWHRSPQDRSPSSADTSAPPRQGPALGARCLAGDSSAMTRKKAEEPDPSLLGGLERSCSRLLGGSPGALQNGGPYASLVSAGGVAWDCFPGRSKPLGRGIGPWPSCHLGLQGVVALLEQDPG